jgi:hypothetical protein
MPPHIPMHCLMKKEEKGVSGLYVALKTNSSPHAESKSMRKNVIKSKERVVVRWLIFIYFSPIFISFQIGVPIKKELKIGNSIP